MKKAYWIFSTMLLLTTASYAQESESDIIGIIDELRTKWDLEAEKMESYVGIKEYCHSKAYQKHIIRLLDHIHHYDTTLYFVVLEKYDTNKDAAAKETIDDILQIETKYTNRNFTSFLKIECEKVFHIEKNLAKKDSGGFQKDTEALEEELVQYIDAITERIDLVDEHIHHLKGFDPVDVFPTSQSDNDF